MTNTGTGSLLEASLLTEVAEFEPVMKELCAEMQLPAEADLFLRPGVACIKVTTDREIAAVAFLAGTEFHGFVRPAFRGWASLLLAQTALKFVWRNTHLDAVTTFVPPGFRHVLAFLRRLGFCRTGERPDGTVTLKLERPNHGT